MSHAERYAKIMRREMTLDEALREALDEVSMTEPRDIKAVSGRWNMTCWLPDTCIGVTMWEPHPCDDKLYMREAWCYGPNGRIGMWKDVSERRYTLWLCPTCGADAPGQACADGHEPTMTVEVEVVPVPSPTRGAV